MDQEKIQRMQFLENNLQANYMQKQSFEMELNEIKESLEEVEKNNEPIYKIIGQLMIKVEKEKTISELQNRKKFIEFKIKSLEDQEKNFEDQLKKLRSELIESQKK